MPVLYRCRWCKSKDPSTGEELLLEAPPEGRCPVCLGFYRHERVHVNDEEAGGRAGAGVDLDGDEAVSALDLFRAVGDTSPVPTGLPGLDHVLGGGLPRLGCALLLAAPPGAGKSTLLYTICRTLARMKIKSIYVSAEQSLKGLATQFSWLGVPDQDCAKYMMMVHLTDLDDVADAVEKSRAKFAVVDSAHTITGVLDDEGFSKASGHSNAVTQVGTRLHKLAHEREMSLVLVGHVGSGGQLKGGTGVQHVLDATLVLSAGEDETDERRVLTTAGKIRVGVRGRRSLFLMRRDGKGFEDRGPLPDVEPDADDEDDL